MQLPDNAREATMGRNRLSRASVFSALVIAIAAAGCIHVGAASASVPIMFGFNEWNDASNYQLQTQLNAPVRRMAVGWNQVEPANGSWNWTQADAVYNSLLANGLKPLLVPQAAPCWAQPSQPCIATGTARPDPAYDGAWSDFVRRLAARYPHAVAVEVWNEPNITPEWSPYPDPARYTQILKEAYRAVKGVRRTMPVISGGLFASPVSGPYGVADAQFLAGMYQAGAKGSMDGIGVHPYPVAGGWDGTPVRVDTNAVEQTLGRVRTARNAAGDSATPIWITETGESTIGAAPVTTEAQQASDLITIVRTLRSDADVQALLIHRLLDYSSLDTGYGVFRANGTPKPAACALSRELQGTLTC